MTTKHEQDVQMLQGVAFRSDLSAYAVSALNRILARLEKAEGLLHEASDYLHDIPESDVGGDDGAVALCRRIRAFLPAPPKPGKTEAHSPLCSDPTRPIGEGMCCCDRPKQTEVEG